VLALSNVIHLFAHELSRLRAGRLALPRILTGSLACFRVRHVYLLAEGVQFAFRIGREGADSPLNRDNVRAGTQLLPLRRLHSKSTIPAATETLSDAIAPAIGIRTRASQCCFTS